MTKVLFICSFHISALWFFTQFSKRRIDLFLEFETGNLIICMYVMRNWTLQKIRFVLQDVLGKLTPNDWMMFVLTSVVKVLFIISTFRIMTFILQKVIFTNYIHTFQRSGVKNWKTDSVCHALAKTMLPDHSRRKSKAAKK